MEQENKEPSQKPNAKPYYHPYNNGSFKYKYIIIMNILLEHNPINFSYVKTMELFSDVVGPEQVSPHYENFLVARKYAIGFLF